MTSFLLELASEEIPARMQAAAAEQLRSRFVEGCKAAGLAHGAATADATPRRLWLLAEDVAAASEGSAEELKGPRADAPAQAIEGFLKKTGLTREQLEERDTGKGMVLFAVIRREGRLAADILAELVPQIVNKFDWPKSMRWGAPSISTASPRWVRPLTGVVALLDDVVVACEVHGLASGRVTRGHRIHAPEPVSITSAKTYAEQLRAAKVLVSSAERQAIIAARAADVAAAAGLTVIPDAGLVVENAGLTEWPVPLLGRFAPEFLAVPREVIQLTMRTNQKYFACALPSPSGEGSGVGPLAPAFVCVANLEASDGGTAIVRGNERVLSARLSDARFFWDQDVAAVRGSPDGLGVFLPKLGSIVFHEKLGTVADKVERVAKLARWLVESGAISLPLEGGGDSPAGRREGVVANTESLPAGGPPPPGPPSASLVSPLQGEEARGALADLAEQAARLCKADLVSATVGEFPEVQGLIGAYLARVVGEPEAVADAIRDHYKPVGQGDDVPTAPVSVAVALADKLDTLVGFFQINEKPTGSRDPFALRRAALGVIEILIRAQYRLSIHETINAALAKYTSQCCHEDMPDAELQDHCARIKQVFATLPDFFFDRLKVQQRDAGVRHDLIDAVLALDSEDDLVRLLARVRALQAFIATDNGANLLAGYKRAANILRIEAGKDGEASALPTPDPPLEGEGRVFLPAESALSEALDAVLPEAAAAVAAEDFTAAMAALARLRAPVDAFFSEVMVNDPDPAVRRYRLALLARFRDACHRLADFSRIEG